MDNHGKSIGTSPSVPVVALIVTNMLCSLKEGHLGPQSLPLFAHVWDGKEVSFSFCFTRLW